MKSEEYKKCVVCQEMFHPDKRTVKRQNVCDQLKCKIEQKRRNNEQWRSQKENVNYFKGRYQYLEGWLQNHPGYLENYRNRKKNESRQKPNDIQVEITEYNNNQLNCIKLLNDIQVELNTNINKMKRQFAKAALPDIQVD